jgi:hypothetical protein
MSPVRKEYIKFNLSLRKRSFYVLHMQIKISFAQKLLVQAQTPNTIVPSLVVSDMNHVNWQNFCFALVLCSLSEEKIMKILLHTFGYPEANTANKTTAFPSLEQADRNKHIWYFPRI